MIAALNSACMYLIKSQTSLFRFMVQLLENTWCYEFCFETKTHEIEHVSGLNQTLPVTSGDMKALIKPVRSFVLITQRNYIFIQEDPIRAEVMNSRWGYDDTALNRIYSASLRADVITVSSHRDCEGALGDVLSSEAHVNHVRAGFRSRVEDVEGAVLVLDDFSFHLSAVWSHYDAGDLPLPRSFSVHHKPDLLYDADGRADAGSWGHRPMIMCESRFAKGLVLEMCLPLQHCFLLVCFQFRKRWDLKAFNWL